jgi:hypothetical protein
MRKQRERKKVPIFLNILLRGLHYPKGDQKSTLTQKSRIQHD